MAEKQGVGKRGEDLAADYLIKQGSKILERNYRQRCGEIDIIARDGKTLVFIEVKTRRSNTFGSPFDAITPKKQQQIATTAKDYLCRKKLFNKPARFDVIGVTLLPGKKPKIEIVTNAFELPGKYYF